VRLTPCDLASRNGNAIATVSCFNSLFTAADCLLAAFRHIAQTFSAIIAQHAKYCTPVFQQLMSAVRIVSSVSAGVPRAWHLHFFAIIREFSGDHRLNCLVGPGRL
jgi:hypothetical protein